ncbi:MAG TPA: SGNH/GDSL hydrolase family protein [Planctomycetota bacterium]|nr:SGNH/GDSL hydrolase family protein [Planctomycetota bacterium]
MARTELGEPPLAEPTPSPPATGSRAPGRGERLVRRTTLGIAILSAAAAFGADVVLDGEPGFGAAQWCVLALAIAAASVTLLPVRFAKRFLLLLFTLALAGGAAEGAMRLLFGEWFSSLFEFHPRYIYTLRPHARTRQMLAPVNGGKSVVTEINSAGYRGPELRAKSPCRVAVYGDSYILAAFTDFDETFGARLERKLSEAVPGVEVVNAGIIGYGPDQLSLKMEDELPRLRPDLVVLSLCPNDFGDLLRNKLFRLDDAGGLLPNAPHISEALKREFRGASSDLFLAKAISKFRRRFATHATPSVEDDLARCRREYESYVVEGNNDVADAFQDHDDSDFRAAPDGAGARYKRMLMAGVLRRIRETCAKQGIPVVVLLIPAALDACETFDGRSVDVAKYPAYRRSAITDAMAEAAAAADLPVVNLFPVFRTGDAGRLFLHESDDHWNAAGQDVAAEQVARYLREKGLLTARSGR